MLEAYRIGMTMTLGGDVSGALAKIAGQFKEIQELVRQTNGLMANMTKTMGAMGGVGTAASAMGKAATDLNNAMPNVARQAEATATAMERAATAGREMLRLSGPPPMPLLTYNPTGWTPNGPTPYGYNEAGYPSGNAIPLLGPGPRAAQSSGPRNALVNVPQPYSPNFTMGPGMQWPPGVPPLPYPGAPGPAGPSPPAVPGGIVNAGVKLMILRGIWDEAVNIVTAPFKESVKADTEMMRLRLLGVDEADRMEVQNLAHQVADELPRTYDETLSDFRHLRAAFGEDGSANPNKAALYALPKMERAAVVLANTTHEPVNDALMRIYKTAELGGDLTDPDTHDINPARFEAGVDAAVRALEAAQGMVGTRDLYNMAKQAGPALRMITDPEARYASILAPLIDLGGARTGTGLTAGMRQFMGGSMARHFAEEMQDLGLIKPGNPWRELMPPLGRNGPIILDKDAVQDGALDMIQKEGFFAWSQKALKADLEAKGITSAPDINRETYRLFSTETFRRIMSLYTTQAQQVVRDAALMKKIPHIDEQIELLKKDSLAMDAESFNAAYSNMLSRLGANLKPVARAALAAGTWMFKPANGPDGGSGIIDTAREAYWGGDAATIAVGAGAHGGHPLYRQGAPPNLLHFKDQYKPEMEPERQGSNAPMPGANGSWLAELTKSITESLIGVAHAETGRPITMTGTVMLDGRAVGQFMGSAAARANDLPGNGPSGPDPRAAPAIDPGFT